MTFIQNLFKKFIWIIVILIALFAFSIFYFRVLIVTANERGYLESTSATIEQKKINVGTNDYGYIQEIKVKIGDMVNEGDTLFRYLSTAENGRLDEDSGEIIEIKANTRSRVKRINFYRSSYITREQTVIELQSAEITVKSIQSISPEDVTKVKIGAQTETILPNNRVVKGVVKTIYPYYDTENGTIEIESTLSEDISEVMEGLPVVQRIFIQDDLSQGVNGNAIRFVESIPNEQIQNLYLN